MSWAVIGYNIITSPQQIEIQTPLVRFVVDLLYSLLYNKSETNRISGVWTFGMMIYSKTDLEQNLGQTEYVYFATPECTRGLLIY